jgi:hypothetical protein
MQELAQARRRLFPIKARGRDIQNQRFPSIDIARRLRLIGEQSIRFEKDEAGSERGALVAIDERMIPAKVEEIRRRDLDAIFDQQLAAE